MPSRIRCISVCVLADLTLRSAVDNNILPLGFFDAMRDTDVYVPGDGPIAWVSRADLGEATAKIVAEVSTLYTLPL
jgi:hypothetical protein